MEFVWLLPLRFLLFYGNYVVVLRPKLLIKKPAFSGNEVTW